MLEFVIIVINHSDSTKKKHKKTAIFKIHDSLIDNAFLLIGGRVYTKNLEL